MPSKHVGAGGRVEVAEVAVALEAGAAASAGGHEGQDDLVALGGQGHARAGLDDGAGALVSEDDGDGDGGVAVHEVAVAAADAGGTDFHQDLAGLRLIEIDLADIERLTNFPQNGSFYLQNGSLLTGDGAGSLNCDAPSTDSASIVDYGAGYG